MDTMSVYRTAPQKERKAAAELRQHGIKAYVPMQEIERRAGPRHKKATITIRTPIAPGYVCARQTTHFAKYVRNRIGAVSTTELNSLYRARRKAKAAPAKQWAVGDQVYINVGSYAEIHGHIVEDKGRTMIVQPKGGNRTISVSTYHLQRPPT